MLRKFLRAKIHRAVVTQCDVDYVGSITIDAELLAATAIAPNEFVLVADITNGVRFETYVIEGEAGSGIIGVNGAAATLVAPGHPLIILAHDLLDARDLARHAAKVVVCDADNRIDRELTYPSRLSQRQEAGGANV